MSTKPTFPFHIFISPIGCARIQAHSMIMAALLAAFLWSACSSKFLSDPAKFESDTLAVFKDAEVDLSSNYPSANHGFTGVLGLGGWPNSKIETLFQFQNLSETAANVSKARLLLRTSAYGADWKAGESTVLKARVFALKSPWSEGRGNWYWNRNSWQNGGQVFFGNYGFPPLVRDSSLDPVGAPGVTNGAAAMIAGSNRIALDTQEISVAYPASSIWTGSAWPGPRDLITLEVDVTEYVKSLKTSPDYGFIVDFEGISETKKIAYFSKELQDGNLGARLVLERKTDSGQNRGRNKMRHHLPQLGKPQSGESP